MYSLSWLKLQFKRHSLCRRPASYTPQGIVINCIHVRQVQQERLAHYVSVFTCTTEGAAVVQLPDGLQGDVEAD